MPLRFWKSSSSTPKTDQLPKPSSRIANAKPHQQSTIWGTGVVLEEISSSFQHHMQKREARRPDEQAGSHSLWSPPPYSSVPNITITPACPADSPYAFLTEFDTIFLVDDSTSMTGPRWKEAEEAIAAIAPICTTHDQDGIDIYFLNHRNETTAHTLGAYTNIRTAKEVRKIFGSVQPRGTTPVGRRLMQILNPYLRRLERDQDSQVRPLNIIAVTDGAFTDDAESVIIDAARRLDDPRCAAAPWQVGIQFFQIGTDESAAEYLQQLDDDLGRRSREANLRDIVDTVPWKGQTGKMLNANGIMKCVLGAVHKKYDRRDAFA